MGNIFAAFILFSTVVTSVGLGIAAAYGVVIAILHTFGAQRTAIAPLQHARPIPVLVARESQAGGD